MSFYFIIETKIFFKGEFNERRNKCFLKTAYKYGKVKDVRKAFDEYPVKEEWHKGKIENILREEE